MSHACSQLGQGRVGLTRWTHGTVTQYLAENKGRKVFLWLVVSEEFLFVIEAYHYSATQEAKRSEPSDAFP